MAQDILSKSLTLMNHQMASQEQLSQFLAQALAMLEVALTGDFSAFDKPTIHYYLLAVDDIVSQARQFNEQLLSNWARIIWLLTQEPPSGEVKH